MQLGIIVMGIFTINLKNMIFDVIGGGSIAKKMTALADNGIYLLANPRLSTSLYGIVAGMTSNKRLITQAPESSLDHLKQVRDYAEKGIIKTMIDKKYPLAQLAEAHHYVDSGAKQGHLIIKVVDE